MSKDDMTDLVIAILELVDDHAARKKLGPVVCLGALAMASSKLISLSTVTPERFKEYLDHFSKEEPASQCHPSN